MEIADNTGVTIPPIVVPMFAVDCGVKSTIVKGTIAVNKTTLHNDIMAVTSKNKPTDGSVFSGLDISLRYYFPSSFLLQILLPSILTINLMFLIIQQAIVKSPPSAVDSLKTTLSQMHMKIDSLETIVTKTEISESYFTWILNSQLGIFTTIIALVALISWKSLQTMLIRHRDEVNTHANDLISNHNLVFETRIDELTKKLHRNIAEANRSIYLHAKGKFSTPITFMWTLVLVDSVMDLETYKQSTIIDIVDEALITLKKVSAGNKSIKNKMQQYDKIITRLERLDIPELKPKVSLLKENLYHIAYSQIPPADLLDDQRLQSAKKDFSPTTSKTP